MITFNRPDHVRKVLTEIRKQKPTELYICQDGPREGNENDKIRCQEVRDVIKELIDWPCNLHTLYQNKNLGCGAGPAAGISWFFEHVEQGIVMEDDCLPYSDFFGYCEELLERYKDDEQVRFINSTLYNEQWQCEASYDFSRYMVTGAWAGWRRTWQGFDLDLKDLDARAFRKHVLMLTGNSGEANWWYSIVKEIQQDESKKTYWDFQMQIQLFRMSALTIHPQKNLVSNIGFDGAGTHTLSNHDHRGGRPVYPILPLTHPKEQIVDKKRDACCWAKAQSKGWWKDNVNYLYESLLWSEGLGHKLLMSYKKLKGKGINSKKV